jgi:hypothetical protein
VDKETSSCIEMFLTAKKLQLQKAAVVISVYWQAGNSLHAFFLGLNTFFTCKMQSLKGADECWGYGNDGFPDLVFEAIMNLSLLELDS